MTRDFVDRAKLSDIRPALGNAIKRVVDVRDFGVNPGDGNDHTNGIQSAIDSDEAANVFLPSGVYNVAPSAGGALTVPEFSRVSLVGQSGTVISGDTTNGPLLNYCPGRVGGWRDANVGISNIIFDGGWSPTPSGVNSHTFDFSKAEGCLVAIRNDNLFIDNCSFYSAPVGLIFESSSRTVGGRQGHVYGSRVRGFRCRANLYGMYFNAYYPENFTTYIGQVGISGGWMEGIYKAAFAATGTINNIDVSSVIYDNVSFLHAFGGSINHWHFGIGQYELGFQDHELASLGLPAQLDFNDVIKGGDSAERYVVDLWDSNRPTQKQLYWGYADNQRGAMKPIFYSELRTAMKFDRHVNVVASISDDPNIPRESVVDRMFFGHGSSLSVRSYSGDKGGVGPSLFSMSAPDNVSFNKAAVVRTKNRSVISPSIKNYSANNFAPAAMINGAQFVDFRNDGFAFNHSLEYIIPSGASIRLNFDDGKTLPTDAGKYFLMTACIKIISSEDDPRIVIDAVNKTNISGLCPIGEWVTFDMLYPADQGGSVFYAINNASAGSMVIRVCDPQALEFSSFNSLAQFRAGGELACGLWHSWLTDGVVDATPTSDGIILTTQHTWQSSDAYRGILGASVTQRNPAPYYEIERMESRLISGSAAALSGASETDPTHWFEGHTPASRWADILLSNVRPPDETILNRGITLKPSAATSMVVRLRTKLRFL